MDSEYVWREGALAMLDALAFRGIWHRYGPDMVAKSLLEIEERIRKHMAGQRRILEKVLGHGGLTCFVDVRFLSDTIVIAYGTDVLDTRLTPRQIAIVRAYLTFSAAMSSALSVLVTTIADDGRIPFAHRGAVAYGQFIIVGNYLIGPAVDDAADAHQQAEGAIVHLTNSARVNYSAELIGPGAGIVDPNAAVFWYPAPMKDATATFDSLVVNPFATCSVIGEVSLVADGIKVTSARTGS